MSENAKKRILWVNEASFLNTGFSVISHEILTYLHKTGKYDIAELGSYVGPEDQRIQTIPWKFFPAMPSIHDKEGQNLYNSSNVAQFGANVFESVCLEHTPDLVIDARDPWMSAAWELESPFRPYFYYLYMPTVDGQPQKEEWLDQYKRSDIVIPQTRFAKGQIEKQAPGQVNIFDVSRPGVNPNIFKPIENKVQLREHFGIPNDAFVLMTVMRNQPRKLFPHLIRLFVKYLAKCVEDGKIDLAKKSYMYFHTSMPDRGWDIPKYLLDNGIAHKVYFTYICKHCRQYFSSLFTGELTSCNHCHQVSAVMTNTTDGLNQHQLNMVYNLGDTYIQYATAEGYAVPLAEAKAAGLPCLAVNYSAMIDHAHEPGGFPIKVGAYFDETVMETAQTRALPDHEDALKQIYRFANMTAKERNEIGLAGREYMKKYHSFEQAAKIFERAIDSLPPIDINNTWMNPIGRIPRKPPTIPNHLPPSEFVDWCIDNILQEPYLKMSYWRDCIVKNLNSGYEIGERRGQRMFGPKDFLNDLEERIRKQIYWEQVRLTKFNLIKNQSKQVGWKKL